MSFAAFVIRRTWVDGHVVLARRFENPRFRRIETFSPRNHLHAFRFEGVDDVDTEVSSWLARHIRLVGNAISCKRPSRIATIDAPPSRRDSADYGLRIT